MPRRNADAERRAPRRNADTGRRPGRLLAEWLAVGAGLSLLVAVLVLTRAVERLDYLIYDTIATIAPLPPPDAIVIVAIDEASLARIGPWPWPRSVHAAAIARIAAAGPRAIGYDVLFTEPGTNDAALDTALRHAGNIVLPMQFRVPGGNGRGYDEVLPVVGKTLGTATGTETATARIGQSVVRPDVDGVVRSLDLALDGTRRWPHVAVLLAGPQRLPGFAARPPEQPLRRVGERLVGFRGPPGSFRTIPFAAVLAGDVPPEVFAGRIVMVGATAAGMGDQFSTPAAGAAAGVTAGVTPGVELQASLVADLLQGRDLRRAGPAAALALALAALWLGMAGLLRLRPAAAAFCGAGLLVLVLAAAAAVFRTSGLWVAPAAALTGLLLAQPLWAWRRLAVVNDWMLQELVDLGRQGGLVPALAPTASADPVTRTTRLLAATIDRVEQLREIADAAIRGLPDATLLVGRDGRIAAANTAAEALFGAEPALAAVDAEFPGLPEFGAAALADPHTPWHG